MNERGTLEAGEKHPASDSALTYVSNLGLELFTFLEAFSSCAIEGNRLAEVCSETLNRLLKQEPVSDRYLLGLAWELKRIKEKEKE